MTDVEGEVGETRTKVPQRAGLVRVLLYVAVPLLVFYLLVPNPGRPPEGHHIDPLTNAVTGWHVGMTGSVLLPGFEAATAPEYFRNIGWYVDSPRGPVSQYPPGAAVLSAPLYRLVGAPTVDTPMTGTNNPDAPPLVLPMPSVAPANVTAALSVALAMGALSAALVSAGFPLPFAVAAGVVAGVATPFWTVAASALWQHGPGAMWVAIGVLLASRSRYFWSGLAFGAAVMTRPHLALIAAAIGVYVALKERDPKPVLRLGAGSAFGLVGLLAYNWWLWGRVTISGGYGQSFAENITGGGDAGAGSSIGFVQNVVGGLFDIHTGLFTVSLFLIPLLFVIIPAWRDAPAWARGAALGGVLYLLVQYKANRYSGGSGFLGYRYPLEPMMAAAPLLAFAYPHWAKRLRVGPAAFWALVLLSLVVLLA